MATMQCRTRDSSINYSSTRTDGGNKGMEVNRGIPVESDKCRMSTQAKVTVMH